VEKEPIRFQSWIPQWRHDSQGNDTQENNIKHIIKNQSDFKAGSHDGALTASITTIRTITLSIAIRTNHILKLDLVMAQRQ
jgi:hypothetical protein